MPSFTALSDTFALLTEVPEAADAVLTAPMIEALRGLGSRLLMLSISDQPPFKPSYAAACAGLY